MQCFKRLFLWGGDPTPTFREKNGHKYPQNAIFRAMGEGEHDHENLVGVHLQSTHSKLSYHPQIAKNHPQTP